MLVITCKNDVVPGRLMWVCTRFFFQDSRRTLCFQDTH